MEGAIYAPGHKVTIGRLGRVQASIDAREVVIEGQMVGNLHASERVEILKSAKPVGDITTPCVSIEEGALFKGSIDIRKAAKGYEAAGESVARASSQVRAVHDPVQSELVPFGKERT